MGWFRRLVLHRDHQAGDPLSMSGTTFDFCPGKMVVETLPPDQTKGLSFNGWSFTAKPAVPFQRMFHVTLYGLRWYLNTDQTYDATTASTLNARRLEAYYQARGLHEDFIFPHPHLGNIVCRFSEKFSVPAGHANSGGALDSLQITLVEHNPGW
jgi:hypothetical protein